LGFKWRFFVPTRKMCYRKDDRAMRPIYRCLKIFWTPWLRAHGYFSQKFSWAFVPIDPMNMRMKFEVRSFTLSWHNRRLEFRVEVANIQSREGVGGARVGRGRGLYRPKDRWWVPIGPHSYFYIPNWGRGWRGSLRPGVWGGRRPLTKLTNHPTHTWSQYFMANIITNDWKNTALCCWPVL